MDTSNPAVIEAVSPRKTLPTAKRQHRSPELKRQIVEETLAPGASVARVARAHGVNANQVFAWRRQYRQGLLGSGKGGSARIAGGSRGRGWGARQRRRKRRTPSGTIEIELPQGQLRLTGAVDAEALRVVLKELLA